MVIARGDRLDRYGSTVYWLAVFFIVSVTIAQILSKGYHAVTQVSADAASLGRKFEHGCRSERCQECLSAIASRPELVIFTGSSSQMSGIDTERVEKALGRPVQQCGIGGARMEDFSAFLNKAVPNRATQDIFHGFTYWEVNRPYPRYSNIVNPRKAISIRDYLASFDGGVQKIQHNIRVRLQSVGVPQSWLVAPFHNATNWAESRDLAQRRAFYFNLFGDGTVGSPDEMVARLRAFIQSQRPFRRLVLFSSPDYRPVLHSKTDPAILATVDTALAKVAAEYSDVFLIQIDLDACGLSRKDFWISAEMTLDPFHVNRDGRAKFTTCFLREVVKLGLF